MSFVADDRTLRTEHHVDEPPPSSSRDPLAARLCWLMFRDGRALRLSAERYATLVFALPNEAMIHIEGPGVVFEIATRLFCKGKEG